MAEYIEREKAIELLSEPITMSMCLSLDECHHKIAQRRIDLYLIENAPTADVRPVVRAHWKPGDIRNVTAVCSNCGRLRLGNGAEWATKLAYFCEKCGADMRPELPKEESYGV